VGGSIVSGDGVARRIGRSYAPNGRFSMLSGERPWSNLRRAHGLPHQLSKSRVALASAALRHVEDAASLASRSPVQAYYLAGYGPERARKAALTFASEPEALELDKAVGHGFRKDAETALALVCTLDPLATRYTLQDWKARLPVLTRAMNDADPTVVTFYSFKGGVGRTTTLAACALLAAQAKEKVVVIDLDLEAPGLASVFQAQVDQGVVDLLVDHLATGTMDMGRALQPPQDLPDELASHIQVIPAGKLGVSYLEKLARLDFAGSAMSTEDAEIPVRKALQALLTKIRDELRPRWILLDARAGLHDLAGLSLHGLAHVDVLFGRANAQGIAGLDLVLQALSRRVTSVSSRVVLVHAMAPAAETEAAADHARLQRETHAMFVRHLYLDRARVPEQDARDADHHPWTIHREERIDRNERLANVIPQLTGEDYRAVWDRIRLLTAARAGDGE
jgi:MinD-like ATPase involved in chromosome partitioning or flagellar assembly